MAPIPKYETPEDFLEVVQAYFLNCAEIKKRTTQAGLCVFAGLNNKQAFNDLEKRSNKQGAKFTWKMLVDRTRLMLEDAAWQRGQTIDIFYLKNHHGMKDVQDIDLKALVDNRNINIKADMPPEKAADLYGQLVKQ